MCIDTRLKLALQFTIALRNPNWICQTGCCKKGKEKGEDKFWGKFAFSVALSTISTTQKCHSLLLDASHFWSHYSRSQCWRRQSTTGIVGQICFFRRFIYDKYHPEVPFFTFRCKPFLKPLQQESMLTKAIHNRYCGANLLFPSLYLR